MTARDPDGRPLDRRQFLGLLGAGTGMVLAGCTDVDDVDQSGAPTTNPGSGGAGSESAGSTADIGLPEGAQPVDGSGTLAVPDDRILVVVDLQGGADGLSTLVPYSDGRYYDLRPFLGVPADQVLPIDDDIGLSPVMPRLHRRGVTTVEGVGPVDGNLSHFSMAARWERGDATGTGSARGGFLGRLIDRLDDGGGLAGVSVGGMTPHFSGATSTALPMSSVADLQFLDPAWWSSGAAGLPVSLRTLPGGDDPYGRIARSYHSLLDLAEHFAGQHGGQAADPVAMESLIGQRLNAAADLVLADVGVRVVYATHPGWDTHQGHLFTHDHLLGQLDVAVDNLLTRLDEAGAADRVLVATISEFGRRAAENGDGFDHGVASSMLLFGQGDRGRFGDRPELNELDADGNLPTAVSFERYLATLAEEWLGIESGEVLPSEPQPLGVYV